MQPEVVHAPRHASRHDTVPAEGRAPPEGDGLSYDADEDPGDDSELNASLVEDHDYDGDEGSSDKHPRAGGVSGSAPAHAFPRGGIRGGEALEEARGADSAAATAPAMWCIHPRLPVVTVFSPEGVPKLLVAGPSP